jgi:hypothetical protein
MLLLEEPIRSAASPEGMIVLAIIYFIIWVFSKVGKKPRRGQDPVDATSSGSDATQQEGLSLERILRQIEQVKQQAEQKEREARQPKPRPQPQLKPRGDWRSERLGNAGPMGRTSKTRLPAAEEVEERDTFEGSSIEVEEEIENLDNARVRQRVDQDEQAEAIVRRRIAEAEARNQAHRNADHKAFDKRIRETAPAEKVERRYSSQSMRDAFIWREILGPPKALE